MREMMGLVGSAIYSRSIMDEKKVDRVAQVIWAGADHSDPKERSRMIARAVIAAMEDESAR